jgi:hypothetical protein
MALTPVSPERLGYPSLRISRLTKEIFS